MTSSIRPKAVFVGLIIDIGGSLLVGVILAIVVLAIAAFSHTTSPANIASLTTNVPLKIAGLVGTLIATSAGGYVAARMGRPHFMLNALALGVTSLVLGLAFWLFEPAGTTPVWKAIAGLVLAIPAALLGGGIASRRAPR